MVLRVAVASGCTTRSWSDMDAAMFSGVAERVRAKAGALTAIWTGCVTLLPAPGRAVIRCTPRHASQHEIACRPIRDQLTIHDRSNTCIPGS